MPQKIFKTLSIICAYYCIVVGIIYVLIWHLTKIDLYEIGVTYYGAYSMILMGAGLLAFYNTSRFPWLKCIGGALFLLTIGRVAKHALLDHAPPDHILYLINNPNPLNIMGYLFVSTSFLVWTSKTPSRFQFLYCFFTACTTIELGVLGVLAYILKFSAVYENAHIVSIIGLIAAGLGMLCSLIYFELLYKVNLYKWLPFMSGVVISIFYVIFAFGIYLNEKLPINFSDFLIACTLIGGTVTSIISARFMYFFLLSQEQLRQVSQTETELKIAKEEEQSALRSAGIGTWRLNLQNNIMQGDELSYQLLGVKPEKFEVTLNNFLEFIHPDDQASFRSVIKRSLKYHDPIDTSHRFIKPNGTIQYLHIKGKVTFNENGVPLSLTGIITDVTEIKYTQNLLQLSVSITKVFERAISVNDAAKQLLSIFHSHFRWELIAVWMRESPQAELQCYAVVSHKKLSTPLTLENYKFENTSWHNYILEKLTENAKPIAIENLETISSPPSGIISKEGLHGCVIVPILDGSKIIGFMELFKTEPFKEKIDVHLSDFLLATGIGMGEFITKIKSIQTSEDMARIVTWSHQPIISCDLEGTILSWNQAAEILFGWRAKEIIGSNIQILFPPDRLQEYDVMKQKFKMGMEHYNIQSQRKTKYNKLLWIEETYSTLFDTTGTQTNIAIIMRDITDEKKAQEDLRKSEEKFRAFVETTDEWIWELNLNKTITYSNPAIHKNLGYLPEEVIGQSYETFIPEHDLAAFRTRFGNAVITKMGAYHQLRTLKDKEGKLRILEISYMPIYNEHNQITGFRGTSRDVTEREEIERHKNEFISMVSHEVKTPLTSIHGALGLLSLQPELSTKSKNLIQLAYRNSAFLAQLTQDIVDIEKIDLGKFDFFLKLVDLSKLIEEAISSSTIIAEKKKLTLTQVSTIPGLTVMADPERLMQVLFNLLSNAINFSPMEGRIYISTERIEDRVRVTIRDEGPGIPEELKPRIFGRFEKAIRQLSNYQKGTGLGLNISKTIIEHMGGTINYTSPPGEGAAFYFELPIAERENL